MAGRQVTSNKCRKVNNLLNHEIKEITNTKQLFLSICGDWSQDLLQTQKPLHKIQSYLHITYAHLLYISSHPQTTYNI